MIVYKIEGSTIKANLNLVSHFDKLIINVDAKLEAEMYDIS